MSTKNFAFLYVRKDGVDKELKHYECHPDERNRRRGGGFGLVASDGPYGGGESNAGYFHVHNGFFYVSWS